MAKSAAGQMIDAGEAKVVAAMTRKQRSASKAQLAYRGNAIAASLRTQAQDLLEDAKDLEETDLAAEMIRRARTLIAAAKKLEVGAAPDCTVLGAALNKDGECDGCVAFEASCAASKAKSEQPGFVSDPRSFRRVKSDGKSSARIRRELAIEDEIDAEYRKTRAEFDKEDRGGRR